MNYKADVAEHFEALAKIQANVRSAYQILPLIVQMSEPKDSSVKSDQMHWLLDRVSDSLRKAKDELAFFTDQSERFFFDQMAERLDALSNPRAGNTGVELTEPVEDFDLSPEELGSLGQDSNVKF